MTTHAAPRRRTPRTPPVTTAAGRPPTWPLRRTLATGESVVAVCGLAGAVMLTAGVFTPPVTDLAPLGLTSWVLPGLWLAATVPVPAGAAAVLALRRSPWAPTAVLVASATLAVEVLVQIPFVGPDPLQAVFGGAALALAGVAVQARRSGWPAPSRRRDATDR